MRFEKKLEAALTLLASTGIWRSSYAPPLYRLLWRLGAEVPPPHFRSFAENFITVGPLFGLVWGSMMWLPAWLREEISLPMGFGAAVFAGSLFGLVLATYYRYGAAKHGIPLWRDYRPTDESAFS
jgi:hypothetical protein